MDGTLEEVLDCKFHIATRWIRLLHHGLTIPDYFKSQNIRSVIIYGITDFALNILEEYKISEKLGEVRAISDKKITNGEVFNYYNIPCISLDRLSEYVDDSSIVLVTPMGWHKEIEHELEKRGLKHVMTIQDLIYDMCAELDNRMDGNYSK